MSRTDSSEHGKAAAGARAAESVTPGMALGLGTGSTVAHYLTALGRRVAEGELPGIVGVPTSVRTEVEATRLGIPLASLEEIGSLDLTVDGADEVDPKLDLIKGLGGALLREKMVAQASRKMIVIIDESKLVERLGTRSPLPVEVIPFSWLTHVPFLESLGSQPVLRVDPQGDPYLTDNGNYILDCHFMDGIPDPAAFQNALAKRAGIVESGLFLDLAQEVLVGGKGGVRSITLPKEGAG